MQFLGHGTLKYASGDLYVGDFSDNMLNGEGASVMSTYIQYIGSSFLYHYQIKCVKSFSQVTCFARLCVGTMKYITGEEYKGSFRDNKRHGYGTLLYNNADIYQGNFNDDRINGIIKNQLTCGIIFEEFWKLIV